MKRHLTMNHLRGVLLCIFLFVTHFHLAGQTELVGSLPGQFGVSALGGATYTIPLDLPSGVNGMQPTLSLVYNSQGGDGPVGNGWSLSGLSSISRVAPNIFTNGCLRGISYTLEDVFALDGNLLVLEQGTYGGDQSVYYTESESFQRIESIGSDGNTGPEWFRVTCKDGRVLEYGHTGNSRTLLSTGEAGQAVLATYRWLLSRVTDPNGNSVEYIYNSSSGTPVLKEIRYANVSVQFSTTLREFPAHTFVSGRSQDEEYLYNTITVKANKSLLYTYRLEYRTHQRNIWEVNHYFLNKVTSRAPAGPAFLPPLSTMGTIMTSGKFAGCNTTMPIR